MGWFFSYEETGLATDILHLQQPTKSKANALTDVLLRLFTIRLCAPTRLPLVRVLCNNSESCVPFFSLDLSCSTRVGRDSPRLGLVFD